MLDRSASDGVQNGWSLTQDGISGKAGGQHVTAIQPAPALVGFITTQGKGLLDEGCKILVPVLVRRDMGNALVAHDGGRIDTVGVAGAGRHEAVGRKQDRSGQVCKFRLLVLPSRAEVAHQMGVFFQLRVAVGRQHFPVGVDVDALSGGLLQELPEVLQIVAGNDDERPLLNVRVHPRGDGMSERLRVGLVQQGHTLEIDPAKLQDEFQPFLDAVGLGQ